MANPDEIDDGEDDGSAEPTLTPEEAEIALDKIRAFIINSKAAFKSPVDWKKLFLFYRQRFLMSDVIAHRLLANTEMLDESDPRLDAVTDDIQAMEGARPNTITPSGAAFALGFSVVENCIRDLSKKMMLGCMYADMLEVKIPDTISSDRQEMQVMMNYIQYYGAGMALLVDHYELTTAAAICDDRSGLTPQQIEIADEVIADNTAAILLNLPDMTDAELQATSGIPTRLPAKEAAVILLDQYTQCGIETATKFYEEVFERPTPIKPPEIPTVTSDPFADEPRPKYLM